ncbi:hypothetical protein [Acidithiobacillus ferriphilus]|uniref:hypothetical protein n=1 Tax=Acidithiobacillus ferriphilus TaxID=1689834 RepID=UPI00232E9710|nr:hypothetical protein [Acidithiobacillus ferriphilus]WCE92941.1 hypothetical protein PJU76_08180 [Acidithiobacillus ferriphilus]
MLTHHSDLVFAIHQKLQEELEAMLADILSDVPDAVEDREALAVFHRLSAQERLDVFKVVMHLAHISQFVGN